MILVNADVVDRQIRAVVAYQFRTVPDALRPEMRLREDLGADSLDLVELVHALEEELGVSIPEEQVAEVRTLADITRIATQVTP